MKLLLVLKGRKSTISPLLQLIVKVPLVPWDKIKITTVGSHYQTYFFSLRKINVIWFLFSVAQVSLLRLVTDQTLKVGQKKTQKWELEGNVFLTPNKWKRFFLYDEKLRKYKINEEGLRKKRQRSFVPEVQTDPVTKFLPYFNSSLWVWE